MTKLTVLFKAAAVFLALTIFSPSSEAGASRLQNKPMYGYSQAADLDYYFMDSKPEKRNGKKKLLYIFHGSGVKPSAYLEKWKKDGLKNRFALLAAWRKRGYTDSEKDLQPFKILLEEIIAAYAIDPRQVYLAGASSGALISQLLLVKYPTISNGAVLIASPPFQGLHTETDLSWFPPVFFVHGGKDNVFPFEKNLTTIRLLEERGAKISVFVDPEGVHEHRPEWNERIFEWIAEQEKK